VLAPLADQRNRVEAAARLNHALAFVMALRSRRAGHLLRTAWVGALQRAAIVVWLTVPVLGLLDQPLAGRLVWTIVVTALPLVIVLVGYHRWRTICPLAWFNRLPLRFGRASRRRMPSWVERRY
jgi:branched-subunit amino acid transport protein